MIARREFFPKLAGALAGVVFGRKLATEKKALKSPKQFLRRIGIDEDGYQIWLGADGENVFMVSTPQRPPLPRNRPPTFNDRNAAIKEEEKEEDEVREFVFGRR